MSASEPANQAASDPGATIRVWDWPLRVCHWSFAVLVPALWWTAENSHWAWHKRLGLTLLGVLIFRIIWGFIGPRTARFSDFVKGPRTIIAYLRGSSHGAFDGIGHNPLGALSVLLLLSALLAQVSFGLFSGDPYDGATGPLNGLVGVLTAAMLTDWHESFFDVIVVLVALHLSAIAFYAVAKMNDLLSPMITGNKLAESGASGINPPAWASILGALTVAVSVAVWVGFGAPPLQ